MKILAFARSILVTLLFPLTIIVMGPVAIVGHLIFNSKKIDDDTIMAWASFCCWMSGVSVEIVGAENIPNKPCLFLFNHSSFFDVFALAGYIRGIRFGAKAELFKIPVFGQAIKILGTLPIARANRQEVYKIYEEAKSRFEHGEMFALSPEGGRFHGIELAPFKAGPFVFAMSAQVPIVPIVIIGAYEALPKKQILFNKDSWTTKIQLHVLKPIETKDFNSETRSDLQKIVYERMNEVWKTHIKVPNYNSK
jgi:1-acyl-sn-glycerol-3-phosphate acyltransferase